MYALRDDEVDWYCYSDLLSEQFTKSVKQSAPVKKRNPCMINFNDKFAFVCGGETAGKFSKRVDFYSEEID